MDSNRRKRSKTLQKNKQFSRFSAGNDEVVKCEEVIAVNNFAIADHSYEASGNDQIGLDIMLTDVKPRKLSRLPLKPSQFNCRFCELKYTSKKRLKNHMECHGECDNIPVKS